MFTYILIAVALAYLYVVSKNIALFDKTGLYNSPLVPFYGQHSISYKDINIYLETMVKMFNHPYELHQSWWLWIKIRLFSFHYSRVCLDSTVLSEKYLNLPNPLQHPIQFKMQVIDDIFSVVFLASNYLNVLQIAGETRKYTEDELFVVRFYLLKALAERYGVHSIEWFLTEQIVKAIEHNTKFFNQGEWFDSTVRMIRKELNFYHARDLRHGVSAAIKSLHTTHANMTDANPKIELYSNTQLRWQKFEDTIFWKRFYQCYNIVEIHKLDYETTTKFLLFKCGRYLIIPKYRADHRHHVAIPESFIDLMKDMKASNIDINMWFAEYFLRSGLDYEIVDSMRPSLPVRKYKFELNKEKWCENTFRTYQAFNHIMKHYMPRREGR